MSLFLIECSYFHIKNSLKTFQNFVYALIYAQLLLIICSLACIGAHTHVGLVCLANTNLGDTITNGHPHADSYSNEKCVTYFCFEKLEFKQMEIYILIE